MFDFLPLDAPFVFCRAWPFGSRAALSFLDNVSMTMTIGCAALCGCGSRRETVTMSAMAHSGHRTGLESTHAASRHHARRQQFGDLDCVQRRTLQQLVRRDEHCDRMA